nr:PREDICTED: free fatty acid receptor 3-like [Latimeria chalumnae]|eukprot:XP_006011226.1 PREDICTED: free fatty acid receptor 3-like [Latimeria chalumnae]
MDGVKIILAIYSITFLTGLPANILASITFIKKVRTKPSSINILLLNLTVSDLIFLLFLPFKMIEASNNMMWTIPYFLCPLSNIVYYSTIYISVLFLTAISVDRYLGVAFPIKYKMNCKCMYVIMVSIFFWILAAIQWSVVYIVQCHISGNITQNKSVCYTDFTPDQLRVLLPFRLEVCILFCISFLITAFSYISLIRILNCRPSIQRRQKQRATSLAAATLIIYIICFAPYNISHLVGFLQGRSPEWRMYTLVLSSLNASLDPIVFYFCSSTLRRAYRGRLLGALMKLPALKTCSKPDISDSESKPDGSST